MPSAALIRKKVMVSLREQILPELQRDDPLRIAIANLPLKTPPGVTAREVSEPLLSEAEASQAYPHGQVWEDAKIHAIRVPFLICLVEGEADLSFGITKMSTLTPPATTRYIVFTHRSS